MWMRMQRRSLGYASSAPLDGLTQLECEAKLDRMALRQYPRQTLMSTEPVIYVQSLRKSYDKLEAVKGIDFQVSAGEVFGLLGPNGAGKTSTIEILEGLRPRTSGEATVLGFDPDRQKQQLKDRIGVCLQATNLPAKIRVQESLELFGSFYSRSVSSEQLLKRLQLWDKRAAFYETLSGGQKQRLALALSLVNDPQLLFLDEPTTGLDPQIRLEIHGLIEQLKSEKRTVVLTTHYIEEAERLCDRVAIMDEGKIVAMGTPLELQKKSLEQSRIQIMVAQPLERGSLPAWPDAVDSKLDQDGRTLTVYSTRPARTLFEIMKWLDQQGLQLEDVHLKRPTLEDVFVELTGKKLRD
jgi:ABC-2 type transport system ATP-binding protein